MEKNFKIYLELFWAPEAVIIEHGCTVQCIMYNEQYHTVPIYEVEKQFTV